MRERSGWGGVLTVLGSRDSIAIHRDVNVAILHMSNSTVRNKTSWLFQWLPTIKPSISVITDIISFLNTNREYDIKYEADIDFLSIFDKIINFGYNNFILVNDIFNVFNKK